MDNLTNARVVLRQLMRRGLREVCLAPGSRSAPLAIAASQLPLTRHAHLDERGLGFYALGRCKASGRPVAVVTTSGTAVANVLPALIEAHQTGLPLIMISADRPPELIGCGANQAIEQAGIFSCHVEASMSLGPQRLEASDLRRLAALPAGPVHLNIAFREPLYGDAFEELELAPDRLPRLPVPTALDTRASTVLVAGQLTPDEADAVLALAERSHAPILADVGSNLPVHELVVQGIESSLARDPHCLHDVEEVLQFGGRLVGKRLLAWLARQSRYHLVSPLGQGLDPSGHARQQQADIVRYCREARIDHRPPAIPVAPPPSVDGFHELAIAEQLCHTLGREDRLLVGNSLAIRALDLQSGRRMQVISNRGASGIDGLLATACGARATVCLLGDTSLLHDLNSLLLASRVGHPRVIVALNNDGGGIFNLLPAGDLAIHRELFEMPHGCTFARVAQQFGLDYAHVDSRGAFREALGPALRGKGVSLIECRIPRGGEAIRRLLQEATAS